ncbi:DUF885 family protein [Sandarakinorhabdus sp.]|uniref:DUF885 family protein n=1 Tax=Sandarakinorhabdus sp. TaxID=1916663 RepID=UPI003F71B26E
MAMMASALALALSAPLALVAAPAHAATAAPATPPQGRGDYRALNAVWQEFLAWRDARPAAGLPDFTPQTIARQNLELNALMARVEDMNVASFSRAEQADWLAVRSKMAQQMFWLQVSKPFSRDPGYYVDQMLYPPMTELPVSGADKDRLQARLKMIPLIAEQGKRTLTEAAADYADLALYNLENADGVGHNHPWRPVPPAGVIGWFDDMAVRAKEKQPELIPEIMAARAAAIQFRDWLKANRPKMTAKAGIGEARYNWYLKNVKLLPYNTDQLYVLGARESQRLWSIHALEEHRNRKQPPLLPAATKEDYDRRKADTKAAITKWLTDEEIITIPADIGNLYVNVPWIERQGGRNFWEEVQYRDPTPDLLHATVPGHAFDGAMGKRDTHPIRSRIGDGVRAEGWGVYLEEAAQKLGFLADRPRTRELIDIFGIFRAVRVAGDIDLQLNRKGVKEIVEEWRQMTPWLDENVARVDAEIYLRRPPGYGIGYTVGMIEMQKLLADVRFQEGDKFELKRFHDRVMTIGRIPMSLIRYDMTGRDDEVKHFWRMDPLPPA